MTPLTVYTNGSCSKAASAVTWLRDRGIPFREHNYLLDPLTVPQLKDLHRLLGIPAIGMVRTAEPAFDSYQPALLTGAHGADDEWIFRILSENPELLQRPIVANDTHALIARPAEKISELLR